MRRPSKEEASLVHAFSRGDALGPHPGESDPNDPYRREARTFPRLSAEMIARLGAYGAEETVPVGGFLYRRGDRAADFFVILDGEVETFDAGEAHLRAVTWQDRRSGARETRETGAPFVMIGAVPNTGWLADCLPLDGCGFVRTGADADGRALPSPYATRTPGIYAVGDVRSGSVKRVASGVGEGSVVVQAIHRFLHPGVA